MDAPRYNLPFVIAALIPKLYQSMSIATITETIPDELNEAFVVDPEEGYSCCKCYNTFTDETERDALDALVTLAQEIHKSTDIIVYTHGCECPFCTDQFEECTECGGLYIVAQQDEEEDEDELDEYQEDLMRGEEADCEYVSLFQLDEEPVLSSAKPG